MQLGDRLALLLHDIAKVLLRNTATALLRYVLPVLQWNSVTALPRNLEGGCPGELDDNSAQEPAGTAPWEPWFRYSSA